MASGQLSPELIGRIVSFVASGTSPNATFTSIRRQLILLCLVSKAFNAAATQSLYATHIQGDPRRIHWACNAILKSPQRLGPLVKRFWLDDRGQYDLGHDYWETFQTALSSMINLEHLWVSGESLMRHMWVLDPQKLSFQLLELFGAFRWDVQFIDFLEAQREIRNLQCFAQIDADTVEDIMACSPREGTLEKLRLFDGPIVMGLALLGIYINNGEFMSIMDNCRPFECMQLELEDMNIAGVPVVRLLSCLSGAAKTLKQLRVMDIPLVHTIDAVNALSKACPQVRHLGVFYYPLQNREKFLHALSRFIDLQCLELDITNLPLPSIRSTHYPDRSDPRYSQYYQHVHGDRQRFFTPPLRALCSELRVYCPSLRSVVLWWTPHGSNKEERFKMDCCAHPTMKEDEKVYWGHWRNPDGDGYNDWKMRIFLDYNKRDDDAWKII